MKKNWIAFVCAALALCLLTACGGGSSGSEASGTAEAAAYTFANNGVEVPIDAEAGPIISALGEPVSYYEAASCAFNGLDKFYTYSSFEVQTYPDGDIDRVSAVILKDDMVATPEGIAIGASVADVNAAYGDKAAENGTIIYQKGNSELWFVVQNDSVVSIEYHTMVLN